MEDRKPINDILSFLRLTHEQEDAAVIQESIEKAIVFRGTNLWILVFAILVASVGLNMNSTAVIIGAMLISPLMGPINGVGYSIATYNFPLLRKSLMNFGFSSSAALVTSTLYFVLTPIHTEHSEILARTSPTIYDVLIALFGGLAGIVAISSKNKGNVIPGVAIATALMPPLCTAGYGISTGNWAYFLGAIYLFLINSVFIALAAMLVSQLLKLPRQTFLLSREIKNKNIAIIAVIALTVIPSFYLGYTLVQKEKFVGRAENFIKDVSYWEDNYLLSNEINAEKREIVLVYAGNDFDSIALKRLHKKAYDLGLGEVKLLIEHGLRTQDVSKNQSNADQQRAELDRLRSTLVFRERAIDSLRAIPELGESLLSEIKALYPTVNTCSYAVSMRYIDSVAKAQPVSMVFFESSGKLDSMEQEKIRLWLKRRLKTNYVELKF